MLKVLFLIVIINCFHCNTTESYTEVINAISGVGKEYVIVLVTERDYDDVYDTFKTNNFVSVEMISYDTAWARDISNFL